MSGKTWKTQKSQELEWGFLEGSEQRRLAEEARGEATDKARHQPTDTKRGLHAETPAVRPSLPPLSGAQSCMSGNTSVISNG